MNKLLFPILIIIGLILFTFSSCSQIKDLSYFEGKWDFKVWMSENKTDKADITAIWILQKNQDSIEYYNGQVIISEKIFTNEIIHFNANENKYVRTIVVADSSEVKLMTEGWDRDRLVWSGTRILNGDTIHLKEVIHKTDENEFEAVFYEQRNRKWAMTQTEILIRIK